MSTRLAWIDALRLTAGLSMVGLHATSDANGNPWPDYDVVDRIFPAILRAFLYIARTELFIIIAIFLLIMSLDKRPRGYRETLAEQSRRLLLPFFIWTLFYAGYNLMKANYFGYQNGYIENLMQVETWAGFFLLGDVKYHMHFIPTLFGILLLYPLYCAASRHPLMGLTVLVFLFSKSEIDTFVFSTLWGSEYLPYAVRATKILSYAGYGVAAASLYGLYKSMDTTKLHAAFGTIVLISCLMFALKLIASYKTIISGAYPYTYNAGYWADFLMPLLLFAMCMILRSKNWPSWISKYSKFSFGIYLAHPIFLDLAELATRSADWNPIYLISAKILFVVPATIIFVLTLSNLSFASWVVGIRSKALKSEA